MERVQGDLQTVEVFENDIELYLSQFCEEYGIEDFSKDSQSRWNAALMYINKHVFKGTDKLKLHKPLDGYVNNNKYLNQSTCNSYDLDKVNNLVDYYIYLCMTNDKEVSVNGFTLLTGITQDAINSWGRDERKLSRTGFIIWQKLHIYREESLVAKLTTMKHPTAIAILLNKHYGYNLPGVSKEPGNKAALSVSQLPRLSQNDGSSVNLHKEIECVNDYESPKSL